MKPQLSITERNRLRTEIIRGALDRSALKKLDLHPHGAYALELFLPKAAPTPPDSTVPLVIERIANDIRDSLSGSALNDPISFLRSGNIDSIRALLDDEDFARVEKFRNQTND